MARSQGASDCLLWAHSVCVKEGDNDPGVRWWLAMLAGWSLLCLVHCSDSELDDHAPAVQTVTELTLVELGLRLVPEGFTVTDLPPKETEAEGSFTRMARCLQTNASRSVLASCRSAVSKPSVNQS